MSAPAETVRPAATGQDKESPARATVTPERKLVAILIADVKDYSRLMGIDEVGTLRTLTSSRATLAALVVQYRGRVVNSVGDNLLAEFASVIDAVQCAERIQRTLQKQNASVPLAQRMEFRIGLNVGDVMLEEGQIYGDGVNIAARLEQLAEVGGICISGAVYDQIANKLALHCTYLGEQTVKNIAQPVRVYHVQLEPEATAQTSSGPPEQLLFFSPFHLDVGNACLWRGKKQVSLTPKDFAVLHYLALRPQQLVKHEELLEAVWANVKVSPGVLKVCLRRIRQVLGDSSTKPRFIETKHRQGYRFIAPLSTPPPVASSQFSVPSSESESWERLSGTSGEQLAPDNWQLTTRLVGRGTELRQLEGWLEKALRGERQFVFVTGEPGIGKTTVVNAFLARVAAQGSIAIGRGQCIEHYGPGEAYLPVLEALGRLCREPEGSRRIDWLRQHAPTWLVQMPALLNTTDLEALQRKVQGATRERMLREMLEAVEVSTERQPFILVLEDLHWSDVSTVELLAAAARRQERARLLIIGTYRPVEMLSKEHPLNEVMQELYVHHLCAELALGLLSEANVAEYLRTRFPLNALPASFAQALHQRTEGNPLFLVNVVDDLVAQEVIAQSKEGWTLQGDIEVVERQVPESIRHLIAKQSKRLLRAEQRILQAASVAGMEFSTAAVAAALEADVAEVEEWCAGLADRQHFLRRLGISHWPDGTVGERYGFLHGLYQHLWHERVGIERKRRLHLRIGERQEAAYGNRVGEIAAELSVHFEEGQDLTRALQYRQQAAMNALQRSANQEAIIHLTKGLELLRVLPDTPERTQQELDLQIALGPTLMSIKGYAAPEVERTYARAQELCRQIEEVSQLFRALWGLRRFYFMQGTLPTARKLGEQLLALAEKTQNSSFLLEAHEALGATLMFQGDFVSARMHEEQGIGCYDPQQHHSLALLYGQDPGVRCLAYAAWVLWFLGYPEQARERASEAITLAREHPHPFSLAWALACAAFLHQFRRDREKTQELADAVITLSREQGFSFLQAWADFWYGWVLAQQGETAKGIAQMQRGLAAHRAAGAEVGWPYLLALLAETCGQGGQTEEGLRLVAEALTTLEKNTDRCYEPELYRIKGNLILQKFQVSDLKFHGQIKPEAKSKGQKASMTNPQALTSNPQAEAEAYFQQAIVIARERQAKIFELRAVLSLSRLWLYQGKRSAARQMLVEIYGWFTEGFDTVDLQEAKALLAELA
ncbi:MAG: AAA family ATPase [Deltaproteobacteria bacterium]|nr:AAA family ATPase [Deltaproteobacteria bacterium]